MNTVEGALQLLARAVRQFHTYPPDSPLCLDAVMSCHEALRAIPHRDRVASRVAPSELIVDDVRMGAGTVVEAELTRRLFKLRVAALEIECAATPRDLSRFCVDLVTSDDLQGADLTFAERLAEHGVGAIVPVMAQRPVVMDVGVPRPHTVDLLAHERRRQQALAPQQSRVGYLYPPDRGWIRADPSQKLGEVSLVDLVVLVDDPAEIALLLVRLTDEEAPGPGARQQALERKYSDVTRLLTALDPRLAGVMFGKLARAVLDLEPERRNSLLQRTVLPGLLDGRADGRILRDFPDMDLAESICLLLDLETAAPEMLTAALDRLDLTLDRRAALLPLIEERRHARAGTAGPGGTSAGSVDRYARSLITVDAARGTDFSEFAAYDLSIDAATEIAVLEVRSGIAATDVPMAQLTCVTHLVRIERNPTLVDGFIRRALDLLGALEHAGRWSDVIAAVHGYGQLAEELKGRRPDVTDTIVKALADYCTPTRLLALGALHERDAAGKAIVETLLGALGGALAPGFVALMNRSGHEAKARALVPLICELAPTVAPALAAELQACGPAAARVIVKVLGHAGAGYEPTLARLVDRPPDPQVLREALRALARIGTPTAAAIVARQVRENPGDRHGAAEDALWHFPAPQAAVQVRDLLRSREWVLSRPQTAARLIDRAAQSRVAGLDEALIRLEGLRFRFWNPSLVQVALKARDLRSR